MHTLENKESFKSIFQVPISWNLEKEEPRNKISGKKETIKIRAEINAKQNKNSSMKQRAGSLININEVNKLLARLKREKEGRH